jgi:hypothetical protein
MTSTSVRQPCIKCGKGLGITTCGGCQEWFCTKHFVEHRQELATQMDHVGQEHDLLQRDLDQENITHPLLACINEWEKKSIKKIKAAAEKARVNLRKYLGGTKNQVKISLCQVNNDLQSSRESDDYTEVELEKWIKQLKQLRTMLEKPSTIEILGEDQTQSVIRLIQLKENQSMCEYSYLEVSTLNIQWAMIWL